ncbi:glycosyltransferase family 50 protein [Patellaria atrata CBS 101060]|uniref:GPI mannosyltransferase 1 n=1 Tax=Patellaria atrata CBS 101060 TaxID=1346257 RepID=A0A9P4S895_9PEZI|nr:glycosyltransferase family 50 protein [Patellaria atrata CBS 101060]
MTFSQYLSNPVFVFSSAIALRAILLVYGIFQDAFSPMKYTDIDYMVFTDAARFISRGRSPYARDTYRYTPILAWLIYPTTWDGLWFSFGKVLFAFGDIVTGWLIMLILQSYSGMPRGRALKFASIWLLNPMVAQISTRGSSEGLLGVIVTALLWAVTQRHITLAGILLGFGVHFKIYPFIYAPSIIWWLEINQPKSKPVLKGDTSVSSKIVNFFNADRLKLAISSTITFMLLNISMYKL